MKATFTDLRDTKELSFREMLMHPGVYKNTKDCNSNFRFVSTSNAKVVIIGGSGGCDHLNVYDIENSGGWSSYKFVLSDAVITIKN